MRYPAKPITSPFSFVVLGFTIFFWKPNILVAQVVAPRTAATANIGGNPAAGEISLSATVKAFEAATSTLTVDVTAFALPNGHSATLKTKKSKQLALAETALIVADDGTAIAVDQIAPGALIRAVGPDEGAGSILKVRQIWVQNPKISVAAPAAGPLTADGVTADAMTTGALPQPIRPTPNATASSGEAASPDPAAAQPTVQKPMPGAHTTPVPLPASKAIAKPVVAPRTKLAPKHLPSVKPASPVAVSLPKPPATALMTFAELSPWLEQMTTLYPDLVTRHALAVTAGGRPVVAFEIRPSEQDASGMRRLAVICRQHGDEPETSAAGVQFAYELLTARTARTFKLRQTVAVLIVPVANPDGAVHDRRLNGLGQDLNRDWGRNRSREVAAISDLLRDWHPNFVVDVHQWVPGDPCQTPMAEASGGSLARRVAAGMCSAARHSGYSLAYRTYGTGGTLCHRHWGGVGVPAILLETLHRPRSPHMRQVAIRTSVVSLQKTLDLLGAN